MAVPTHNVKLQFAGAPFILRVKADRDLSGIPLVCTVRSYQDGPVVAQCSTSDGSIALDEGDAAWLTVTLWSDVTELWPIVPLYYDVQADPNVLESYTVVEGCIGMMQKITRSRTTTPPIITARLSAPLGDFLLEAAGTNVNTAALNAPLGDFALQAEGVVSAGLLDGTLVAPHAVFDTAARVLSSYTGNIYTVRREDNGAEQPLPYVVGTNRVDQALQATHCGAAHAMQSLWNDQSGAARNLEAQVAFSRAPKVYDGVTGAVELGGEQAAFYTTNEELGRADSLGLSGDVGISVACVFSSTNAALSPGLFSIGSHAVGGQRLEAWGDGTATGFALNIGGARRVFTCPNFTVGAHCVIFTRAAGATVAQMECYWNGVQLPQKTLVNGGNTLNLVPGYTLAVGGQTHGIPLNGNLAHLSFWPPLGSSDRAKIFTMANVLHGTPP